MKALLTAPGNWTYFESGFWERELAARTGEETGSWTLERGPEPLLADRPLRRDGPRLGSRSFIV